MNTHRHVFWIDANGNPCEAKIIRGLDDGRVIVRFATLPPRCIMPQTMALPTSALVPLRGGSQ